MSTISVKLITPAAIKPGNTVVGASGTAYVVDASGYLTVTDSGDLLPLLAAGFNAVEASFGNHALMSSANAMTALSGGGQPGATPLANDYNRFTTVAAAGDSAILPVAVPGMCIAVKNAHATNSMNVFPATGGAINALSANAAFAVANTKLCLFYCSVALQWDTLLTA